MDGQGRVLAGAVCGSERIDRRKSCSPFQRNTGPICAPFNAWVVLKGLETLDLRARRQSDNALEVGRFIEGRGLRVLHPGLPSHPQHELAMKQMDDGRADLRLRASTAGASRRMALLDALRTDRHLEQHRRRQEPDVPPGDHDHHNMGPEGRAEAGIEDGHAASQRRARGARDLIEDLDQAFARAGV